MDFFNNMKKTELFNLLISVAFIIIGIILVINPEKVLKIISFVVGIAFLALGAIKIFKYLKDKNNSNEIYFDIVIGLMAIIAGLIIMFCTSAIEAIFRIIIGVWIVFMGCTRLSLVKKLKMVNLKEWIISLALAIIMIICGLYMIFVPGTVVAIIGGIIIVFAVINLMQSIMFLKNFKVMDLELKKD